MYNDITTHDIGPGHPIRSFCADSSSPRISGIPVGHFMRESDKLQELYVIYVLNYHNYCYMFII